MSEAQAEQAVQQLYENESLRGDLMDEEATALLAWGEAQIMTLAGRDLDDETFDAQFVQLRRLMTQIGRFAVKQAEMPADAKGTMLAEMLTLAQALEFKADPAQLEAFVHQHEALPIIETVRSLTSVLQSTTSEA